MVRSRSRCPAGAAADARRSSPSSGDRGGIHRKYCPDRSDRPDRRGPCDQDRTWAAGGGRSGTRSPGRPRSGPASVRGSGNRRRRSRGCAGPRDRRPLVGARGGGGGGGPRATSHYRRGPPGWPAARQPARRRVQASLSGGRWLTQERGGHRDGDPPQHAGSGHAGSGHAGSGYVRSGHVQVRAGAHLPGAGQRLTRAGDLISVRSLPARGCGSPPSPGPRRRSRRPATHRSGRPPRPG